MNLLYPSTNENKNKHQKRKKVQCCVLKSLKDITEKVAQEILFLAANSQLVRIWKIPYNFKTNNLIK